MKKSYDYNKKTRQECIIEFYKTRYGWEGKKSESRAIFWDSVGISISEEELSKHDRELYKRYLVQKSTGCFAMFCLYF